MICVLCTAGPARAQEEQKATFPEAAALADFPVYKPHRTLGLKARVTTVRNTCVSVNRRELVVHYGRSGGNGPHVTLYETKPYVCGDAGERRLYRKVRILGHRVRVEAGCETSLPPTCGLRKGGKHFFIVQMRVRLHHRLTAIGMTSDNLSFKRFVRMARSLRPVKPGKTVHLTGFLSDDRTVWCGLSTDYRWCTTKGPGQYGAHLFHDGTVELCQSVCANNWDDDAPVLRDGQRSLAGGYTCADAKGAITCTVASGKGFRIAVNGASTVGP
jgi:hypothetical protein